MTLIPLSPQRAFIDAVPHNHALGMQVESMERGAAVFRLPYRADLVGNPESGVLHGGVVTALLDACSGAAVFSALPRLSPIATLDLRCDFLRPAEPLRELVARAECYRLTRNVAFTRALAHHGDATAPVAAAAGTFMLSTKRGDAAAAGSSAEGPLGAGAPVPAPVAEPPAALGPGGLLARLAEAKERGELASLLPALPYVSFLGLSTARHDDELVTTMRYRPHLIGNPRLPALHGGTLGALVESAAIFELLARAESALLPKTITLTIDYLRSAAPRDTHAVGVVTRHGRRVANVHVEAWQEDRKAPVVTAHAMFLVKRD